MADNKRLVPPPPPGVDMSKFAAYKASRGPGPVPEGVDMSKFAAYKASKLSAPPEQESFDLNIDPSKMRPTFMEGVRAGLTAQPGEGVGHFLGAAAPATAGAIAGGAVGGIPGAVIGAELGEVSRQAAGAVAAPEETAQKSFMDVFLPVTLTGLFQAGGSFGGPALQRATAKAGTKLFKAKDWFNSRVGKGFLKSYKTLVGYGHEPEKALLREKIVANNWDELITKAKSAKTSVGKQIDDVISKAEADTLTNIDDVLSPLDDMLGELNKFPRDNKAMIRKVTKLREDIYDQLHKGDAAGQMLNSQRANEIKKSLYKITKYKNTASDEIPINKVKQDVARKLAGKIAEVTEDLVPLNKRYGDLVALEDAATNRAIVAERANLMGIPEFAAVSAGLLAASYGGPVAGLATAAATEIGGRVIGTPMGATQAIKASGPIAEAAVRGATKASAAASAAFRRFAGGMGASTAEIIKAEQTKAEYKEMLKQAKTVEEYKALQTEYANRLRAEAPSIFK